MDFFLRYAPKLVILVDAQAIVFLRLCKDSQGILLRFSLELSKYDAEVHHVPGVNNEVSDVLSRHHVGIDKILEEAKSSKPMTEEQTVLFLKRLCIPENYVFSKEEVATLLELDSLPNPVDKKKKQSAAKMGERQIKNVPQTLSPRKIKLPKESMKRPGVILPARPKKLRMDHQGFDEIQSHSVDTMSYSDFKTSSKAILRGILTKKEFQEAQENDEFCSTILNSPHRYKNFVLIDGLLYSRRQNRLRLCLPIALLDIVINSKHFSVFGLHFSKTRILRDINDRYHVQNSVLNKRLQRLQNNCLVCQFNSSKKEDHHLRQSDYIHAPRVTWGVDLIPNMPLSRNNRKVALLAVDLFSGYIQICPMKDRTTQELIAAIDKTIIKPFGVPKFLRSDEEPGLFNSKDFYDYLQPHGIKFLPTAVGSPWANSTAERSVRTIKDAARNFLLQEKADKDWEKYVDYFTSAHNKSISVYGFSPEQLLFGHANPNTNDLLQFWPNTESHTDYAEKIIPLAIKNREIAAKRAEEKRKKNRTYKNADRVIKTFQLGQIVAHRQLQVATGSAMSMKPRYTGPYTVEQLLPDGSSALIEHMHTGHVMKAHFSNMQVINYHPAGNRVHANFDNDLQEAIEKDLNDENDEDLSQMLSQRASLLTRTVRHLGDPDWQNDSQNQTQAKFVDSDGEELHIDPSEAVLTQPRPPVIQPEPARNESDESGPPESDFDQAAFAQFVVHVADLQLKLLKRDNLLFYVNHGFHLTGPQSDYEQSEMDYETDPFL